MNPIRYKNLLFSIGTILTFVLMSLNTHAGVQAAPQRKINIALGNMKKSYIGMRAYTLAKSYNMKHPRFHCHPSKKMGDDVLDKHCDRLYGIEGNHLIINFKLMSASSDYLSFVLALACADFIFRNRFKELKDRDNQFVKEIENLAFIEALKYWRETKFKHIDNENISDFIDARLMTIEELFNNYQNSEANLLAFLDHRRSLLGLPSTSVHDLDDYDLSPRGRKQKKKLAARFK